MKQQTSSQQLPFVDDPTAKEIYATEAFGFYMHAGNIHITFTTPRADYATSPGSVGRKVAGRIVMPSSGAQSLAVGLFNYLKKMGIEPTPTKDQLQ